MTAYRNRFFAILVVVCILLSATFSGCTSSSPTNVTPSASESVNPSSPNKVKPTKITYWHTYGDAEDAFFNESVLPL